jgi:type IV secretory pathway VirB2 component (pilin)
MKERTLTLIFVVSALVLSVAFPSLAFAGLQKIEQAATKVSDFLQATGLIVATIGFAWVGYKWYFGRAALESLMPVIGGTILVSGAAEIASFFFD